ncbi:MAG: response regulator [Cyclobacteriaceae bacterium]
MRAGLLVLYLLIIPIFLAKAQKGKEYEIIDQLSSLSHDDISLKKELHRRTSTLLDGQSTFEYNLGRLWFGWGDFYKRTFDYDSAILYFERGLGIFTDQNDVSWMGEANLQLAYCYTLKEEFVYSTKFSFEAQNLFRSIGDSLSEAKALDASARNFYYTEVDSLAMKYFDLAVDLLDRLDEPEEYSRVLGNLAVQYTVMKDYDKATATYEKAISLVSNTEFLSRLADNYIGLAIVKEELSDYASAKEFYTRALEIALKTDNQPLIGLAYQNIAYFHLSLGNLDSAEQLASITMRFAEELNNNQMRANAREVLHATYYRQGRYKEAYELLHQHKTQQDSIFSQSAVRKLSSMHAQSEIESQVVELAKMANELSELEKEKSNLKRLGNTLIVSIVILLVILTIFYRSRQLNIRSLKTAELNQTNLEQKKKELEALDHAKSKWFINISHELRTPLMLISGSLRQLLNLSQLTGREKVMLSMADRNANLLEELMDEILDLSKVEEGMLTLNPKSVNLVDLLSKTVELFRESAERSGIELTFQSSIKGESLFVKVDQPKVQKVIMNLLSNALKFTPEGGAVQLVLSEKENHISMSIKDTGDGISKKDLPYVFDRFYQSGKGEKYGGTGVGLSLSKEIALMHKGDLKVHSQIGVGSTFIFNLPAATKLAGMVDLGSQTPDEPNQEAKEPIVTGLVKEVLLVDDSADMKAFLESFLPEQYKIVQVRNGYEAFDRLENEAAPDVIVLDIMMPRMDGITFVKSLKDKSELKNIPVIMLTAVTDESEKLDVLRVGVEDYITKPFNPEELLIKLENLLIRDAQITVEEDRTVEAHEDKLLTVLENEVKKYIADPDFNVMRLADAGSFSERQLYRYLKQTTGYTPANFVKEIRLQRAFELARKQAVATTSELSYKVGFSHTSYFTTVFKKRFGKTPAEMLREN